MSTTSDLLKKLEALERERIQTLNNKASVVKSFNDALKGLDSSIEAVLDKLDKAPDAVLPFVESAVEAVAKEFTATYRDKCVGCGHPPAAHFDENGDSRPCAVAGCDCEVLGTVTATRVAP